MNYTKQSLYSLHKRRASKPTVGPNLMSVLLSGQDTAGQCKEISSNLVTKPLRMESTCKLTRKLHQQRMIWAVKWAGRTFQTGKTTRRKVLEVSRAGSF